MISRPQPTASNRAQRRRKLRTSVRGKLPHAAVRADDPTLTAHAGLLPMILFLFEHLAVGERLRQIVGKVSRKRVHPIHYVLLAFVVGALAGTERMAHLECMSSDPMLVKFLRLSHWPVRKVFAGAFAFLSDRARRALADYVSELGLQTLAKGTLSVVVDIDSTAIVDYGEGEGSKFGYCGKGRRRRRHYPLVASVAGTRAIVLAKYRDGSSITAEEMIAFLDELIGRLRAHLGPDCTIAVRGDAGVWCPRVGRWLNERKIRFVMALPLGAAVKLQLHGMTFESSDDEGNIEFGTLSGRQACIGDEFRVAVIRRRVHDAGAPPQGKRVDEHPHWRFQAVVSNEAWAAEDLWRFYNGRADCERVFRVGKQALALGHLVSRSYAANEVAFLLRAIAFNVDLRFQDYCERRARESGRRVHHVGLEWRQPRFYRTPGRLISTGRRLTLRVPKNPVLAALWEFFAPDLVAGSATEVLAA